MYVCMYVCMQHGIYLFKTMLVTKYSLLQLPQGLSALCPLSLQQSSISN